MSIWCTTLDLDADDHAARCARWSLCRCGDPFGHVPGIIRDDRHWRYDGDRDCTCAAGPIVYRASHVVPRRDAARGGCFDLAEIAAHIGPDGKYSEAREEAGLHLPYLRVGMRTESGEWNAVVLDAGQVRQVRDTMTTFLRYVDAEAHRG